MNPNEFESDWQLIRRHAKTWWKRITNEDLNKVDTATVKYFEFVTRLQLRYELDRQVTKDEIDRRLTEFTNHPVRSVIASYFRQF